MIWVNLIVCIDANGALNCDFTLYSICWLNVMSDEMLIIIYTLHESRVEKRRGKGGSRGWAQVIGVS